MKTRVLVLLHISFSKILLELNNLVVGSCGPANHPRFEDLKLLMSRISTSAFQPPEIIMFKDW